jgi:hypothetical protein
MGTAYNRANLAPLLHGFARFCPSQSLKTLFSMKNNPHTSYKPKNKIKILLNLGFHTVRRYKTLSYEFGG